jgi:hypothetical protein
VLLTTTLPSSKAFSGTNYSRDGMMELMSAECCVALWFTTRSGAQRRSKLFNAIRDVHKPVVGINFKCLATEQTFRHFELVVKSETKAGALFFHLLALVCKPNLTVASRNPDDGWLRVVKRSLCPGQVTELRAFISMYCSRLSLFKSVASLSSSRRK